MQKTSAYYSHAQEWTSIEMVKDREYMGYCRNNDEAYLKTIKLFLDKKDEIVSTIESFTYLQERDLNELLNYIESFYSLLNNPERFISTLKSQCRASDF
ncbi:hypothetical protein N9164_06065 [Draconibacterium sp.]|nr:hypothetical protein [Draconibacterium sp.]